MALNNYYFIFIISVLTFQKVISEPLINGPFVHNLTATDRGHGYVYNPIRIGYPVFNKTEIPSFIFDYLVTKNKYKKLLAGLALYSLGAISSETSDIDYSIEIDSKYFGEPCKFVVENNGKHDEMGIPCDFLSVTLFKKIDENHLIANNSKNTNVKNINDRTFNGYPVTITAAMKCFVQTESDMKGEIQCGLLQKFADSLLIRATEIQRSPTRTSEDKLTVAPIESDTEADNQRVPKFLWKHDHYQSPRQGWKENGEPEHEKKRYMHMIYVDESKKDEIDLLFEMLAKSVKGFPKIEQIKVKLNIIKTIYQTELKLETKGTKEHSRI